MRGDRLCRGHGRLFLILKPFESQPVFSTGINKLSILFSCLELLDLLQQLDRVCQRVLQQSMVQSIADCGFAIGTGAACYTLGWHYEVSWEDTRCVFIREMETGIAQ